MPLKKVAMAIMLMLVGLGSASGTVRAQDLQSQLVGPWALVSLVNTRPDGTQVQPYGPGVRGVMTLLPTGHFTVVIVRPDLPKYAANNRLQGTADEYQATVHGSLAYFGKYAVDGDKLTLVIDSSSYPNWNGETQTRTIKLVGDDMEMLVSTPTLGGRSVVMWKRLK